MNWKLIALLGVLGALVGLATALVGMRPPLEFAAWTAVYLLWAWMAVRLQSQRPLLTGVLAGAFAGICAGTMQTLFLDRYVANNPWLAEPPATSGDAALAFVAFGAVAGAVFGLIFGVLARVWLRRWPPTSPA
jgi:hypothetical protein